MNGLLQLVKVIREMSERKAWNLSDLRRAVGRVNSGGDEEVGGARCAVPLASN
jgi:hypothetical protein